MLEQARGYPGMQLGGWAAEGCAPDLDDARVVGALLGGVAGDDLLPPARGDERERRLEELGGGALAPGLTTQEAVEGREVARIVHGPHPNRFV
jgi:hypothetical protein